MDDISSYEVAKIIAGKMLAILNGSRCATSGLHAVYPFALEALRELKSMGVPLALVTNKGRELSVKALRKINAELFFTAIVGGDTCPRRKPDPMPLHRACELLGVEASRVCMVGDSLNDVRAARRAEFRSGACLTDIGKA
jgi:phosphoglycolate phosphatase